jgi:hypothetical protein
MQQRMHERGHEHGLARALQTGDGNAMRVVIEVQDSGDLRERRPDRIERRPRKISQQPQRRHRSEAFGLGARDIC